MSANAEQLHPCLPAHQDEVANALGYYHRCGVSPEAPSGRQVAQALALTNGNARELRELVPKIGLLKINMV